MIIHEKKRRILRTLARIGAIGSAVMLSISAYGMNLSGVPVASAAATDGGPATVIVPTDVVPGGGTALTGGGSSTAFSLKLPANPACTGDSAGGDYRVQSYMVPASLAPGAITFDSSGPTPNATGAAFRQPLWDTGGAAFVDRQTANADTAGGPGPVINLPAFDFKIFTPQGLIPAGTYNIGIACTKGPASPTQVDKFWNAQISVVADGSDQPAGIAWTVLATSATTTTSTSTTSSSSTTTTTPKTTTTSGGTTTTTAPCTQTTTTTVAPSTTSTSTSTTSTSTTSTSTSTTSTSTTSTSTTSTSTTSTSTTSTTVPPSTTTTAVAAAATGARLALASTTTTTAPSTTACLPAGTSISRTVAAGGEIVVTSTGWKPGTDVGAVLNSDPIDLGKLKADASGSIAGAFKVPMSVPLGEHELVLTGTSAAGVARTIRAPITVTAAGTTTTEGTGGLSGGAVPAGTSVAGSLSSLPLTGGSTMSLVVWSVLLLIFGRMAVLLGRPPRVLHVST